MADREDGGGGSSACAWVTRAPLHQLLTAAQASAPLDQHLSDTPQHLQDGCISRDWLRWYDRRERRSSDMATCPHSSQWPLCATFNCFCAVGGELGCPGFAAPAGASSSLLLLAPTACWVPASPGTVSLCQPGWSEGPLEPGGEQLRRLGCPWNRGQRCVRVIPGAGQHLQPFPSSLSPRLFSASPRLMAGAERVMQGAEAVGEMLVDS